MNIRRALAASVLGAMLVAVAGVGHADTFYNDIDLTIDAELETMELHYDSLNMVGQSGSTIISMREDDAPDHPNCNINGVHDVTITATSSDPSVAVVTNGPDFFFESCGDTNVVNVQATGLGTAVISFTVTTANVPSDPHITFDAAPADFRINVTEGSNPPVGCDADPAAPAWANAILQASGYKPKAKNFQNWVSIIANEMTQMAMFDGYLKGDHPNYENAVRDRLVELTGNGGLVSAQQAARPGWVCTTL